MCVYVGWCLFKTHIVHRHVGARARLKNWQNENWTETEIVNHLRKIYARDEFDCPQLNGEDGGYGRKFQPDGTDAPKRSINWLIMQI